MSLLNDRPVVRTAAWRISLWGSLAFALGTLLVFIFLHSFVADDIQRRSDAWLAGEVEVLADVAERTPKDALYGRIVGEVAELVRKGIPSKMRSERSSNDTVFFLQTDENGALKLWAGAGSGENALLAIKHSGLIPDLPGDLQVNGFAIPFRVVSIRIEDGSRIYLGLSERDQLRVLRNLRLRFCALWSLIVLFGFAIVFIATRRMLRRVQLITEAASRIGHSDLGHRVPTTKRNDEVAHLALTLNHMLDRIESSMRQLHTITDSLAHDLRSPLTAIRGNLEMSLAADTPVKQAEAVDSAIEELDCLTEFLSQSLDIAEAKADALRLTRREIDLDELLKTMIDLYGPNTVDKNLTIKLISPGAAMIHADEALIHRMIGNLFDNEIKHLPQGCTVTIHLRIDDESMVLEVVDDGPGFPPEVLGNMFKHRVKGEQSRGHGLGLAFIDAVARAHGGVAAVSNRPEGGAQIEVSLPVKSKSRKGDDDVLPSRFEEPHLVTM